MRNPRSGAASDVVHRNWLSGLVSIWFQVLESKHSWSPWWMIRFGENMESNTPVDSLTCLFDICNHGIILECPCEVKSVIALLPARSSTE